MSITTEEQRRELMRQGWGQVDQRPTTETWLNANGPGKVIAYYNHDGELGIALEVQGTAYRSDVEAIGAALSILQIPIPGYRIIREEGAADVR